VDTIFAFEEGGKLRQYPGNYTVYLDYKREEEEAAARESAGVKEKQKEAQPKSWKSQQDSSKPRKLSSKEKREFEMLEGKIAELEAEKALVEKALYSAPPGEVTKVRELYERVEQLKLAIDGATERWLELAELGA
jgi:ATP-binding cassette subfamily F protein uup